MQRAGLLAVLTWLGGCGGSNLDLVVPPSDAGMQGDSAPDVETGPPRPPSCANPQDQPTLLSNTEYNLTVRDLLGDLSAPADHFFPDGHDPLGMPVFPDSQVMPWQNPQYAQAADTLAHAALARLDTLLPCDPVAMGEDACAMQFIDLFGKRAYRRPLSDDSRVRLRDAYGVGRRNGTFPTGIEAVIAAALKSPHFLQVEIDATPGRPVLLDGYEMASRLSYFIYHSMPDAELFAAADAGQLTTIAGVVTQAQRMLRNKKAIDGLNTEITRWLALDRLEQMAADPATATDQASLYRDMQRETLRFAQSIFFNQGTMRDLLRSTNTWLNGPLAAVYGVGGITGTDLQPATLDPQVRAGLLTQASLLTLTSSPPATFPTGRGTFVIQRLLCMQVPPPPNSPLVQEIVPQPGESKRQAYAAAFAREPICAPCHNLIDPIGFALESFDGLGRFRTTDNGALIDPSGTVMLGDVQGDFAGPVQLAEKMMASQTVTGCVAQQWISAALHRNWNADTDDNRCTTDRIAGGWNGGSLNDLIKAIVRSDAFWRPRGCFSPCPPRPGI